MISSAWPPIEPVAPSSAILFTYEVYAGPKPAVSDLSGVRALPWLAWTPDRWCAARTGKVFGRNGRVWGQTPDMAEWD